MSEKNNINYLYKRFRGFYPVVVDVETAGLNAKKHALLEISAITLKMDNLGWLKLDEKLHFHIVPFPGSMIEKNALEFNRIDPYNPLRKAVTEYKALKKIFNIVYKKIKKENCNRAILVAHNASFDLNFINAAAERAKLVKNPFHPFVTFDTATLSGLILGQTVLARACKISNINFDIKKAHSALYDSEMTATLFCKLVNKWKKIGGWPLKRIHYSKN